MSVMFLWLSSTCAAILGMVGYDIVIKIASEKYNALSFTAVLAFSAFIGHAVALGIYRFYNPAEPISLPLNAVWLASLGALGFVIMDLGFFMGVKYGGLIKTNTIWLVGGLILTSIIGILAFQEEFSVTKLLGIGLGLASIVLLVMK